MRNLFESADFCAGIEAGIQARSIGRDYWRRIHRDARTYRKQLPGFYPKAWITVSENLRPVIRYNRDFYSGKHIACLASHYRMLPMYDGFYGSRIVERARPRRDFAIHESRVPTSAILPMESNGQEVRIRRIGPGAVAVVSSI